MITAVLLSGEGPDGASGLWLDQLRTALRRVAVVVEADVEHHPAQALGSLPVDLITLGAEYLTEPMAQALGTLQTTYPDAVTLCAVPQEVAERARVEGTLNPDFWIILPASDLQLRTQLETVAAFVSAGGNRALARTDVSLARPASGVLASTNGAGHMTRPENALYRMVGRMTGSFDAEHLLEAFCEAVHEMTGCVNYCLLWQQPNSREFRVVRAEGLPPVVPEMCRFAPTDPLPSYLQRNRGIVVRDQLAEMPERAAVLRELDLCGGVLAIPMFSQSVLRGILAVGPKVLGIPYQAAEAEALFVLSANAANAARQAELHRELEARNAYIDQILFTMESGVVTIDLDARIRVCNPCAARILRVNGAGVIGRDLRALPSPLGDYLYSCLTYGEERSREELAVLGGQVLVRVSTRRLLSANGSLMGSMMLVEDLTVERALAAERRRSDRNEVIGQVVARFAHELKNPLVAIHTFAELLPSRFDDLEFVQFWSEHVMREVRRLDDLVAKLVSLSEQPPSKRQVVDVAALVQMAIERVAALDDKAPEVIQPSISDDLPAVQVDAEVMAAALSHLLRYGLGPDHKPVRVEAALQPGPEGEQPVAIFIRTTNNRTDPEEPIRLLDPSWVLDHPDVDLGPSASQRLVESQGGALVVFRDKEELVFQVSLIPSHDHHDHPTAEADGPNS
jgi:nitrogen-specific signal transduction histidine kinase